MAKSKVKDKVEEVVTNYRFEILHSTKRDCSIRCWNPENPDSDYLIVVLKHFSICTCVSFEHSVNQSCKHIEALNRMIATPKVPEQPAPKPEPFRANALSKPVYSSDDW